MSGIPRQKKAVIDIGTTSIKLCIALTSNDPDGYFVIYDDMEITSLGKGLLENKELEALPSEHSINTIQRFVAKAHEFSVDEIRAVGTAALRKAANAYDFCSRIYDTCGINVEILQGEREAQLSHSAAILYACGQDCLIFDIGGGSTEFVYTNNNEVIIRTSLNFGVLYIHEKHFLHEHIKDDSIRNSSIEVANNLHECGLIVPESDFKLIGIGGTITTMASIKLELSEYLPNKVNGTVLKMDDIESQIYRFQNLTPEERSKILGLHADRADIILAGACIVRAVMNYFHMTSVIVSTNGVRHAVLAEMFK